MRRTEDLVSFTFKKGIDDPISFLTEFFSSELSLAQIETSLIERQSKVDIQNPKLNLHIYFQIEDYIKSKNQKVTSGCFEFIET